MGQLNILMALGYGAAGMHIWGCMSVWTFVATLCLKGRMRLTGRMGLTGREDGREGLKC